MRRFLVMVVATGLAVLIAEGFVRVLDLPPRPMVPLGLDGYRLSENEILRFEYQPGFRPPREDEVQFATNEHGFRDRERSLAKPPGGLRVLALGDSTTVGVGVAGHENTYPALLEAGMRARGRADIEVLNLGVGGYDTHQAVELLRVRGLAFAPDLVSVLFCLNDFGVADGGVYQILLHREGRVGLRERLASRSRLALSLFSALGLVGGAPSSPYGCPVESGLSLLADIIQAQGVRAVVFLLPAFDKPFEDYGHHDVHARVRQIGRANGLDVVDLLPRFQAAGVSAAQLSADGMHPNARGHELLAEILLPLVSERIP